MKEDLLMRFIDGTATPEEVETVIDMLSRDDDAAKEWMQMANAAGLADTAPAMEISEQEAEKFVLKALHKAEVEAVLPKRKLRFMPWILSGAVVAAAVAVVISFSFGGSSGGDTGMENNLQADVIPIDTVQNVISCDTVPDTRAVPEKMEIKEYVAKTETEERVTAQKNKQDVVNTAGKGTMVFEDDMEQEAVQASFNVLKPAKTPYRVRVRNIDKDFVFKWESEYVKHVSLLIIDSDGIVLLEKEIVPSDGRFPIRAAEFANLGELTWTMTATSEDEAKLIHTGKIEFIIQ